MTTRRRTVKQVLVVVLAAEFASAAWCQAPPAGADQHPAAAEEFFETKVRPVLATNCFACHTEAQSGGLRLDSREALLKGGSSGAVMVPGDPEKSLLIQAVRQTGELKMPKGGHLRKQEIDDLAEWVKMGAPWPGAKEVLPAAAKTGFQITPEQ